jgi:hypothetical protein
MTVTKDPLLLEQAARFLRNKRAGFTCSQAVMSLSPNPI